jgi:hypothetical protein
MIVTKSRFRLAFGASLLASTVVLAGCGDSTPVTRTAVSEQTTTAGPTPMVATATISTSEDAQKPVRIAHVHHRLAHYAMHHRRAQPASGVATDDRTTTINTTVTPTAVTSTTRKTTDTTTSAR